MTNTENDPKTVSFAAPSLTVVLPNATVGHVGNISQNHFLCPEDKPQQSRRASSIERVRQPNNETIETEAFIRIKKRVQKANKLILQCHGVPGSGKSQLIRQLAREFPFAKSDSSVDSEVIKWHIQCNDSGHDALQELKELAKKLTQNYKNITQEQYENIASNLDMCEASKLVNCLSKIQKPVLILVEDPQEKDKDVLSSFCTYLNNSRSTGSVSSRFHVYISSRKINAVFSFQAIEKMPCYKLEEISGFSKEESIKFLNGGQCEKETAAAAKIYQRFGGLPLGLSVAKGYCKSARIDYLEYLDLVDDVEYDVAEELEATRSEFGHKVEHVFQALVMPFLPSDENNVALILPWKILRCISYFHYDRIPRFALEQCCHLLRDRQVKKPKIKNKSEIGRLISKLMDHSMCTETDKGEITFHEVVLNSFRLYKHSALNEDFHPLKKAMEVLCSLASKDLRKKEKSLKMNQLRRHLESLLGHVEKDENVLGHSEDKLLLKAMASHLHETVASIMLFESSLLWKKSDKHYKAALELLWPEMSKYSELTTCECEKKKEIIARDIIDKSRSKGSELPDDFIVLYASKLEYSFDDNLLTFLKQKSKSDCSFKEIEKILKEKGSTQKLVENLQKCELFLSDYKYRPIFYAERLAFILHSWSRIVLYVDSDDLEKMAETEKYICMSTVSNCVSVECEKRFGVSILAKHLSKTGGWIPILLKLKRTPDELQLALNTCEEILRDEKKVEMYENGMLKDVFGPSSASTRISLLRYIVRINARLPNEVKFKLVLTAPDDRCKELFQLSEEFAEKISLSLSCLIYCGKYYASKNEFDRALTCFRKYFELETTCKPRFDMHCWAIYNHARAVRSYIHCSLEDQQTASENCQTILSKFVRNRSLRKKINGCWKGLQNKCVTA